MSGPDALPPGFDRHAAACRQVREAGGDVRTDPAVRLIATQIAFVLNANSDTDDYGALVAACRALAGTPPAS